MFRTLAHILFGCRLKKQKSSRAKPSFDFRFKRIVGKLKAK